MKTPFSSVARRIDILRGAHAPRVLFAAPRRKASRPSVLRTVALAALALCAPITLFAQGNDNATGVTGMLNGNSHTGCSYDPYTANATRTIPDIVVSGAVGSYPLVWARIMNSRGNGVGTLGAGGGWRSSYDWSCTAENNILSNTPYSYTVHYPDGRIITFSGSPMVGPLGVTDRFGGVSGTGDAYLFLSDGGQVVFHQTATQQGNEFEIRMDPAKTIIDPGGRATTLLHDPTTQRLTQVTEPAGRWLKIYYDANGTISHVDASYTGGPITQKVTYSYTAQSFGGSAPYRLLTGAAYSDTTSASYTYQAANTVANGTPLIKTCQDVRYPGPMKNIWYGYKTGGSYGQLYQEKSINGVPVDTLTVTGTYTRKEARGDGPTRTWTYNATTAPYLLKSFTDFQAHSTILSYDTKGLVSSIQDANGHATLFAHHSWSGAVVKITHPGDGSTFQNLYDANGYHLQSTTDERGKITTYKRNPSPTFTPYEIDYPDGGVEAFNYNGYGQVTSHTMVSNTATGGSGGTETFIYDTANRGLLWKSYPPATTPSDPNPSAHPTIYTYDANDHLSTIQSPRGVAYTTTLTYNQQGQLKVVENPDADHSQTVYTYNNDSTLLSVATDYAANTAATVSYTYDDYKRIKSVTTPLRSAGDNTPRTTWFYYGAGDSGLDDYKHADANVTSTVLPSGKVVKKVYDENKRVSTATAGYGTGAAATSSYTYDNVGNLKTMKDPIGQTSGAVWAYNYDVRNRLLNVIDPIPADRNADGYTISYVYDVASNKTSEKHANDQTINYVSYDNMNRLTQQNVGQAPTATAITYYGWTKAGQLDTMTDPNNNVYDYAYDAQNRPALTTYPGGTTETRSYDFAGNLATFKNRAGATQSFTYDVRNREKTYSWSDGSVQARTLSYDDASRVLTCNTANTFITNIYFNDGSLQSQEEWANGAYGNNTHRTLSYTYNADGNRASATLPGVLGLNYDYTARNQVWHASSGVIDATYGYDLDGNVTSRALNDSVTSSFVYDAVNRIKSITHPFASGSKSMSYGYDAVGNRTLEDRNGFAFETLGYDKNSQMTSFDQSGASTSLTYDASGNRTKVGSTNYGTANSLNQYPTVGGTSLSYSGNGNLTRYNGWSYTYDAMNRLSSASGPGGASATFYYDGLNRQVQRIVNGALTANVWDGWDLFAEYGSGGVLKNTLIHGAGSDLLGQRALNLAKTFFYPDGSGNTAFLADGTGSLIEKYTYDLSGTPAFYDGGGTVLPNGSAYKVDMLFTGQKWYSDLGLYDLRNRAYLPGLGRFLQPDPIGFGGDPSNIYRYCGNNPVNGSDPSGLEGYLHLGNVVGPISPATQTYQNGLYGSMGQFAISGAIMGFARGTWGGVGVGAALGTVVGAYRYISNTPYPDQNPQLSQGGTDIRDFGGSTDITGGQTLSPAPDAAPNTSASQADPSASDSGDDSLPSGTPESPNIEVTAAPLPTSSAGTDSQRAGNAQARWQSDFSNLQANAWQRFYVPDIRGGFDGRAVYHSPILNSYHSQTRNTQPWGQTGLAPYGFPAGTPVNMNTMSMYNTAIVRWEAAHGH